MNKYFFLLFSIFCFNKIVSQDIKSDTIKNHDTISIADTKIINKISFELINIKINNNQLISNEVSYLKNRDLVSDVIISKTENKVVIELNSVPGHMETNPNFERIKDTKSVWKLEYLTKNKTKVSLQSYAVIEGIPTFISDFFILESPLYSLNNLKDHF